MLLNGRVEWHDGMPPFVLAARKADVPNHAPKPASHHKRVEASLPNPIQLFDEVIVVDDVTELARTVAILFRVQ
jgi:hypothetical protein